MKNNLIKIVSVTLFLLATFIFGTSKTEANVIFWDQSMSDTNFLQGSVGTLNGSLNIKTDYILDDVDNACATKGQYVVGLFLADSLQYQVFNSSNQVVLSGIVNKTTINENFGCANITPSEGNTYRLDLSIQVRGLVPDNYYIRITGNEYYDKAGYSSDFSAGPDSGLAPLQFTVVDTPPPSCSIGPFVPDNFFPEKNTSTNLRFSFNGVHNWSIQLITGNVNPSPMFGSGSEGTVVTNNISDTQVYMLLCDDDFRYLTIIPKSSGSPSGVINVSTHDDVGNSLNAGWRVISNSGENNFSNTGNGSFYKPVDSYKISGDQLRGYSGPSYSPTNLYVSLSDGGVINYNLTYTSDTHQVNGACGAANKTYPATVTSYGSDAYCESGNPSNTPPFPVTGSSSSWYCVGIPEGVGFNSPLCTASVTNPSFSVNVIRNVGGFVKSSDGNINCGNTCIANYQKDSTVTLNAYPNSTYWKFTGWEGDCVGMGQCTLNINNSKTVKALFVARLFDYREF